VSGTDWAQAALTAAAGLRPGEPLLGQFPAMSLEDSEPVLAPAELMPVAMAVGKLMRWRYAKATARESAFPLAPRMVIVLTRTELLIWSARRRWRLGDYLGSVSRARIIQATAPTVGDGWRTVLIYLVNEPTVPIRVPGKIADQLAALLPPRVVE
jgi:hypothetical protein